MIDVERLDRSGLVYFPRRTLSAEALFFAAAPAPWDVADDERALAIAALVDLGWSPDPAPNHAEENW